MGKKERDREARRRFVRRFSNFRLWQLNIERAMAWAKDTPSYEDRRKQERGDLPVTRAAKRFWLLVDVEHSLTGLEGDGR